MPGISASRTPVPFQKSGANWSSYWTTRSLFFLDGTIITVGADKYFKDKSSAARNFLITGYDFDSTWTKGFPYKSAATISAPVGDATLIAADINNFLYDAGGTPNAIPVVSLFQNIDYENKIYCRHVAQVVDGNGVETTEPHVIEVFMVDGTLSASDLTKAATYFGVSTEDATAYWIDPVLGNNTTGNGSKALPWKTVAAVTGKALTADRIIYIITGSEPIGSSSITSLQDNTWKGIGNFIISGTASNAYQVSNLGAELHRVNFNLPTKHSIYGATNGINTVKFCRSISGDRFYDVNHENNTTIESCVASACSHIAFDRGTHNTINVLGCFGNKGSAGFLYYCLNTSIDRTVNVKYNKSNSAIQLKGSYTEFNLINNYGITKIDFTAGVYTGIMNIKYNTIIPASAGSIICITVALSNVRYIWNISHNTFINNNITANHIGLINQINPIVEYNLFLISGLTNQTTGIVIDSTGQDCGIASVRFNKYVNPSPLSDTHIMIGNGTPGASDNMLFGSIIEGNYEKYSYIYQSDINSVHGIFISRTAGCSIIRNRVDGGNIGLVFKETAVNDDYAICAYNLLVDNSNNLLSKGCKGVKYYNNTVLRTSRFDSDDLAFYGLYLIENTDDTPSIDTIAKNNIIVSTGHELTTDNFLVFIDHGSEAGLNIDYNIYYSKKASGKNFKINVNEYTFAEWQALGYDAHSIFLTEAQALALFTDPANGDYSLKAGSLAIGAGIDLGASYDEGLDASTDWGTDTTLHSIVTKQQGVAWDIGAYIH